MSAPNISGTQGTQERDAEGLAENPSSRVTRFADIAVELGYCTRAAADEAARGFIENGGDPDVFGQVLVEDGLMSREQARACERAMRGRSSIGGFAILEKVGQGGMGTVFRARQISMDRIVAVKILAPKFAQDPAFKQRFLNEARTSAKLSHLNIINGIDCGEDCGYTFFAMEFVEGRTAKQILEEKGKLAPAEAFAIVKQMADALSYARKFGMVHRDIKPDNIMLTPSGQAKLCDLGLAMQAETEQNEAVQAGDAAAQNGSAQNGSNGSNSKSGSTNNNSISNEKTQSQRKAERKKGLALGTPHYMSPEQARGESNIDARSDIYSLGATWYHFLTGHTLFEGKNSLEVMTHQCVAESPNPCALNPEIPRGMGLIISKMTAKSPADRYATADELIEDLNACVASEPLKAGAFNAKTSCAILPGGNKIASSGIANWIPHIAAALALGVLAYYGTMWLGQKQNTEVARVDAPKDPDTNKEPHTKEPLKGPTKLPDVPVAKTPEATVKAPVEVKVKPDTEKVKPPVVPEKAPERVKDPVKVVVPEPPPVEPEPVPAVLTPPPAPELPKPELKLNADILYSRFLAEVESRVSGKIDLGKLYKELNDLSLKPEYAVARTDIDEELKDIKGAHEFETKTLKKFAEQGVEFEFTPDMAKKWGVPKAKIVAYDEVRGLSLEVKGVGSFSIPFAQIPQELLLTKSYDKSVLAQVRYNYARGNRTNVFVLTAGLPPEEQKRWLRKTDLLIAKEKELTAREAFLNLQKIADSKSWKTFTEMAAEFQRDFGTTPTCKAQAHQIKLWQDAAQAVLQPPSRYRALFHAASVRDLPDRQGRPDRVEVVYDFKTPEQLEDFNCPHGPNGRATIDNGRLIVPEGGGEFATLRFFAPLSWLSTFKVTAKSQHATLKPFGVVYVEPAQAGGDPNAENTALALDPESKSATLRNWRESNKPAEGPPTGLNWLKDTHISFDNFKDSKGEKMWTVEGKNAGTVRLKDLSGGWIALYGAQGNFTISKLTIVFKPDPQWIRMMLKKSGLPPPEPPPPAEPK